eukprot:CAMPEP_0172722278 /NCGR_PEP_ID=MMETSP1074-20121228/81086_1 /TAXON_ID=2916 /ORGANISM="Ceratium fusus, Strain PA161109" /LENGTH=153 /DNA_ID=CAMNT_0013548235 /DNA_START=698 /DNA_END=1159 /DNA_ORIENTATION=-
MTVLLFFFFIFHVRLMFVATTTIEFCEKRQRYTAKNSMNMPNYDMGFCKNMQAVLGPQPLLWLFPVSPPQGDGVTFLLRKRASVLPPQQQAFLLSNDSAGLSPLVPAEQEHFGVRECSLATNPETVDSTAHEPQVPREDGDAPEVTGEKAAAA